MDQLLSTKSLPPGFRFHPTDEELFMFYLKRKVLGRSLRPLMITELDIYQFGPWDLPDKSWLKSRDLTWYFFCPRSHKYSHGARTNRSTEGGYWKSTGNDRTVQYNHRPVGKVKTLIFHMGKAPKGERTDWVMHEYRLDDKDLADKGVPQDSYVICKVYKKSGLGPRNGEQYGAPFVEEEWESDDDENLGTHAGHVLNHGGVECGVANDQGGSVITSALHSHDYAPVFTLSVEDQMTPASGSIPYVEEQLTPALDAQTTPTTSVVVQPTPVLEAGIDPINDMEQDELDRLLAVFSKSPVPSNDIYNGLEDLTANEFQTSQMGFDWTQFLVDNGDYYVELDDLNENLKN